MELVGTYRLVSCELRWADGSIECPYGSSPEGLLIYSPTGHFSGHLMRRDVTPFRTGARQAPAEVVKEAFLGYLGYYGTYTLDRSAGTVTHHVLGSWHPNWVGTDQLRSFRPDGERITIETPPVKAKGSSYSTLLVWKRVGPS